MVLRNAASLHRQRQRTKENIRSSLKALLYYTVNNNNKDNNNNNNKSTTKKTTHAVYLTCFPVQIS